MKISLTLPPSEVESIVRNHLLTKFKIVGDVKSVISTQHVGYGAQEHLAPVYSGIKCEVEDVVHEVYDLPSEVRIKNLLAESLRQLTIITESDKAKYTKDVRLKNVIASIETISELLEGGKPNA